MNNTVQQQDSETLRQAIVGAVARAGVPRFLHLRFLRRRLTILMYHGLADARPAIDDWCFVPLAAFRAQMEYLRQHFTVLPLGEAVERLRRGRLGGPTAAITFDDGFQSTYELAYPILREHQLPATIFLVTDLVDTDDTVWFCRLDQALANTRLTRLEWRRRSFDLGSPAGKFAAVTALQDRLRELPHPDLLREVRRLSAALGGDGPPAPPFRILTAAAVREMAGSGLIDFGAHSRSHAVLSRIAAPERRREIEGSVAAVAELTGRPCTLFAYPNGRAVDYNADCLRLLHGCGVEAAVTTITGANHRRTPPLELRRLSVAAGLPATKFQLRTHHWAGRLGG